MFCRDLIPAAPLTGQQYLKCGSIRLLYIACTVTKREVSFSIRSIPRPRETILDIVTKCSSRLKTVCPCK